MSGCHICNFVAFTAGITYPSGNMQKTLLLEIYKEAEIDPSKVSYVELHGTGTKAGDPEEANAATDVFCTSGNYINIVIIVVV